MDMAVSVRGKEIIPNTPPVISPTPTQSENAESQGTYMGPTTRSAARRRRSQQPFLDLALDLDQDGLKDPQRRRARTRSRSPLDATPATSNRAPPRTLIKASTTATIDQKVSSDQVGVSSNVNIPPTANGHLSPTSPSMQAAWPSWHDLSRSPSPLGLIPIHRHWRTFVHKYEVPRKALHISIGFLVIWLYQSGTQTRAVCPYLMVALIPIAAVDVARHHLPAFNRLYVRILGALMRESEFMGYNGVIFYLFGAWTVLYLFPKDVGIVAVLLLSWCDTAASAFGRRYGRFTPRIRRGKSLAGSLAAFLVGVGTAAWFWGWLAPNKGPIPGDESFLFTGALSLPARAADAMGLTKAQATISGGLALALMSLLSGLVAAASEVVDVFGWDDNFTIPVLSGLGIWAFLKMFG